MAPLEQRIVRGLLGDRIVKTGATHITGEVVSTAAAQFQFNGAQVIRTATATVFGVVVCQAWCGAREARSVVRATALRHMACGVITAVTNMTGRIICTTRLTNVAGCIVRASRLVSRRAIV